LRQTFNFQIMPYRSRAPLRLGLAGGGTDVSPYSNEFGGYVLNATINYFSYCFLSPRKDDKVCFEATDRNEKFEDQAKPSFAHSGELQLHKAVYNRIVRQFNDGKALPCNLTTYSDAPAGSGLGTSSTMVVAIIGAFAEWLKLPLGEYEVAHMAYEVERLELGLAGGKQDQYAAAFGGFNFMEFSKDDRVIVNPLRIKSSILNELQSSLVLYYTGVSRDSAKIIGEQIKSVSSKAEKSVQAMHQLKADALLMKEHLLRGEILSFAQVLGRSWASKKQMATVISNSQIDAVFETALAAGAISGKVSGAGGGGFIMFMVDPALRERVVRALKGHGGQVSYPQFTHAGMESWKANGASR
jgi:D-glycero-alpha-D-manno-heptose-7-phosphate kinase